MPDPRTLSSDPPRCSARNADDVQCRFSPRHPGEHEYVDLMRQERDELHKMLRQVLDACIAAANLPEIPSVLGPDAPLRAIAAVVDQLTALRAENAELREAVIDVCDAVFSARTSVHGIRCIRAAASDTKVPFGLAAIQKYATKGHDDADMWCQSAAADCYDRDEAYNEMLTHYNEAMPAGVELVDMVEELNADPSDCRHNPMIAERAKELRAVFE